MKKSSPLRKLKWTIIAILVVLPLFIVLFDGISYGHLDENKEYGNVATSIEKTETGHWGVKATIPINASRERVWNCIGTPGYLEMAHPFCKANPVAKWPGVGSKDTILYHGAFRMVRDFFLWNEPIGYALNIDLVDDDRPPLAKVYWNIEDVNEKESELSVCVELHLINATRGVEWTYYRTRGQFTSMENYLGHLIRGIKYHTETGKPVQKNQFGYHRWFSPNP